jgi:hypothetical protein
MKTIILLLLIILLILLVYTTKKANEYFYPRSINYDQFYKFNRDLNYVSNRLNLNVKHIDNIKTNQIPPIMGPQNNMYLNTLWGSAKLPNDYSRITNRIPDKYSTLTEYNHPIVNRR